MFGEDRHYSELVQTGIQKSFAESAVVRASSSGALALNDFEAEIEAEALVWLPADTIE